ncbi:MAG: ATP-binding protein [Candidatus Shikimatogenerans bostrichidophilus]|nr:MAG: ATP-binding protein [Candidatus Shikimatogenerans bostrichidophilus]
MEKGIININLKRFFLIIKKFLYSNNYIFIRELISNANDAIIKLIKIIKIKKLNIPINSLNINIFLKKNKNTITILDNGIGMTKKEIIKYINNVATSGSDFFLNKSWKNNIIGFFGLGFYTSFFVSDKVEILSKSYINKELPVYWCWKGNIKFYLKELKYGTIDRGTKIVLHINNKYKKYLENNIIYNLLKKYFNFLPCPIYLNNKSINYHYPIWIKNKINNNEFIDFYHYLYKDKYDPIFWIHLNTSSPFNLKCILFLPTINKYINIKENYIFFYYKKILITNNIKEILPDVLVLFKGIIESPDILFNISKSNIKNDKKLLTISDYIIINLIKKILYEIEYNRKEIINKWRYLEPFIIYGILSNYNFLTNYKKLILLKHIKNKYLTINELIKKIKIKKKQIDKNNRIVILYSNNYNLQYHYIKLAIKNGYKDIIINTNSMFLHMIQKLEIINNNLLFVSVDSDLSEIFIINSNKIEKNTKKKFLEFIKKKIIINKKFHIKIKNLSNKISPIYITKPEFINRYKKINFLKKNKNVKYNLVININNKNIKKIIKIVDIKKKKKTFKILLNFYFLLNNLLEGKKLNKFINKIINYIL